MAWSVGAGLEGRGVILTGATGGIGSAVAAGFAAAGAKIMAVDLDQGRLDEVVGGLEGSGHVGVAADLRDTSAHEGLVQRAVDELGEVYVLANLAAVLRRRGSLDEVTEDDCRGLARTFGPHKITVNCVSPGQVHTPMLMTDLAPEIYERMKQQTPLGYVAEPEELAGPVVFLASDHARYITGATLNVSGGFLMY
jgi:NAD(P)-dependent dehydrogenase (short-subunit alcohol dehydrogenase family)